jgi:hypothetical protein
MRTATITAVVMTALLGSGRVASAAPPSAPDAQGKPQPAAASPKDAPAKPAAPAAKPAAPAAKAAADSAPVTLTPRASGQTIYSFEGRIETGVRDVTFEAPQAYQESFSFWTSRMKGTSRTELIQHLTTTRDPAADGQVPFRRQVSRYLVDMNSHGQAVTMGGPTFKEVTTLAWEGIFDPTGRIASMTKVNGPENVKELENLSFPVLDNLFPRLEGPRTLKVGESFVMEESMPLPSRLAINGLEKMGVRMTRRYTLRERRGRQAVFDVEVMFAADPATPPSVPRTTCVITGGGKGDALFDLEDGTFVDAKQPTRMVIDVEAPLRRLPDQPEGSDPGVGKTHMEISLLLSGNQTVTHLAVPSGESAQDAAPTPAPESAPQPAPASGGAGS